MDPSRPTHKIPLTTYYPCDSSQPYPLMVFGHASGSQSTWYDYIWKAIVPQGYIVTFPGSYEYFNDSHKLFAADMAYTLQYFFDECNTTESCPLYGMLMNKSMVSGHSFGGAASLLVAGGADVGETVKYQFTSMMTLSGCGVDSVETNYTHAASNIHIPSLLITGSSDCMCCPKWNVSIVGYYEHNIPDTTCKYLGVITNSTHCHFQSDMFLEDDICSMLEEKDCDSTRPMKIKREKQLEIVSKYYALCMYQTLYADDDQDSIQQTTQQLRTDVSDNTMFQIGVHCQ